jgi:ParB-like chromosome segregation protein Spo0J
MEKVNIEKITDVIVDTILEGKKKSNHEIMEYVEKIREFLHRHVSIVRQPVDYVRWIPIEKIHPNDYNPNSVAKVEMGLLYKSIKHDGYTQPIVTIYDPENDRYVIVDGFHRYFTAKASKDILERNKGMLPVVVIDKDINERMASTIRHNRARGEHSVSGMSSMVFKLLDNGWKDEEVCNHLGLEPEELLKLKHITGFAKLFENVEYKKAWETKRMMKFRMEHKKKEGKK